MNSIITFGLLATLASAPLPDGVTIKDGYWIVPKPAHGDCIYVPPDTAFNYDCNLFRCAYTNEAGARTSSVDTSKPTICGQSKPTNYWAAETGEFYFVPSSVRKSVCTLVRQLRGPHLRTCA